MPNSGLREKTALVSLVIGLAERTATAGAVTAERTCCCATAGAIEQVASVTAIVHLFNIVVSTNATLAFVYVIALA
ncbi:hypothetical protein Terro_2816 [Terriglobus roseus DSM 18391]|uniref:Uncharacterized protein n=1 Tax=Terriglobus roseus (strain DSM 18391 / NRRL B-41598 / KBS 63) TaxID=926566 RepID=I3ZII4_TERRK|nr:hypothetical protein Terro_2816 [Terriglobus roseus DSM 18391]